MELVRGYFTVERNIVGDSLSELELKLGFRPGRLAQGARVLVLRRPPQAGAFVFAGSTRYSDAKGLVDVELRGNVQVPHAWLNQRLLKILPNLGHTSLESYPTASSPIEQWQLLVPAEADEICQLESPQRYWPPRRS